MRFSLLVILFSFNFALHSADSETSAAKNDAVVAVLSDPNYIKKIAVWLPCTDIPSLIATSKATRGSMDPHLCETLLRKYHHDAYLSLPAEAIWTQCASPFVLMQKLMNSAGWTEEFVNRQTASETFDIVTEKLMDFYFYLAFQKYQARIKTPADLLAFGMTNLYLLKVVHTETIEFVNRIFWCHVSSNNKTVLWLKLLTSEHDPLNTFYEAFPCPLHLPLTRDKPPIHGFEKALNKERIDLTTTTRINRPYRVQEFNSESAKVYEKLSLFNNHSQLSLFVYLNRFAHHLEADFFDHDFLEFFEGYVMDVEEDQPLLTWKEAFDAVALFYKSKHGINPRLRPLEKVMNDLYQRDLSATQLNEVVDDAGKRTLRAQKK